MEKHRGTELIFFFSPSSHFFLCLLVLPPSASSSSPVLAVLIFSVNSILYWELPRCRYDYIKLRGRDKSFNSNSIKYLTKGFMRMLIVLLWNKEE